MAKRPPALRLFIAVELSDAVRAGLADAVSLLSRSAPERSVNWVRPENIHLTLKFLGDAPEDQVPKIQDGLSAAAGDLAPFSFSVAGLGCFPNPRQPRVVWAGIAADDVPALVRLQAAVEAHIVPLGYPPEARGYSPHITLGRVRRDVRPAQAAGVGQAVLSQQDERLGSQAVTQVALIKSALRPGGPVYTRMFAAQLARNP